MLEEKKHSLGLIALTSISLTFLACPSMAMANTYWVSVSGNDSNNCSREYSDECRTIQKALSKAGPGDTVNVKSGKYKESSANSPYTDRCSWMGDLTASLCANKSGTPQAPIVLQAAPGHEGNVVIDSESKRVGLQIGNMDYIHIRGLSFINNRVIGVASWGQIENQVPDENRLSIGIVIENCYFYNTWGPGGVNSSAIGMWGSKDWIVRNSKIEKVKAGGSSKVAGIQSYGVINALIEHNEFVDVDMGIYWKDHFVANEKTREKYFESEIRYNLINASLLGIQFGIRGSKTVEAGNNYVHHNIIYGYSGRGIYGNMAGAFGPSGYLKVEHNILDSGGNSGSSGITIDAQSPVQLKGNIFLRNDIDIEAIKHNSEKIAKIEYSDYNVFDSDVQVVLDRYSDSERYYRGLTKWQSALSSQNYMLKVDRPDRRSISVRADKIYRNIGDKTYSNSSGSPLMALMPDGTNAGPYQKGNEIIGIVSSKYDSVASLKIASKPIAPSANIVRRSK